ncbi:insulin-like growth factor-binding protein complex acid labile subunit [Mytilus trossulus]|uniref:insulin-like growth factor-binding protein complex acid labile subunit n=1 Tax=Mytilus trossulus TaxID=6551 RepID=UPI003006B8DB
MNEDAFEGLHNLRSLYLSKNSRYPVDENLSLPKNVFKYLVNLTVLDLSYNNIDSLHEETLNGLLNLQQLKLNNNLLKELPNDSFQYTPKLAILDLSNNFLNNVTEGVFNGLRNLHHLYLNGNYMRNIQNNAFISLINLTDLNLLTNTLNYVNEQIFAGLPKLRHLYLGSNCIKEISNNTFGNMTDLKLLDLSKNSLSSLNEKTFIGLRRLEDLRLNLNLFKYNTKQLPPGCFQPLESLKHLSVQMNNPQNVPDTYILPDETIKDLKKLKTLELDVNFAKERILGIGFSSLYNLSSLVFSSYSKFSLLNDTFRYTTNLTHFSCKKCNIMILETGTFLFLTQLKFVLLDFVCPVSYDPHQVIHIILSMSKTPVEILEINNVDIKVFFTWKKVNYILLDTRIRELHITNKDRCVRKTSIFPIEKVLPTPVSLQSLDLSSNGILQIGLNLTYVIFLDLSNNELDDFLEEYSYAMNGISRLEYICLSNNLIKHLISKLFINQPRLRIIDLSFNKLTNVSFELTHLVDLEILNVSSNTIRYLDDGSMKNIDRLFEISKSVKVDLSNNTF